MHDMDMTVIISCFNSASLVWFPDLTLPDISHCTNFDTSLFVDCIPLCVNLVEIIMINCKCFTQCQMVKILTNLSNLEAVDCTRGTALNVVFSLKRLRTINVEPKDPLQFDHSVLAVLPTHNIIVIYFGYYAREFEE